jgi:hypothetical protein
MKNMKKRKALLVRGNRKIRKSQKVKAVRSPGIEPGSLPWQGSILPLDHERRASEHGAQ